MRCGVRGRPGKIFHASLIEGKGREITVGTSQVLERGHQIYMMPVPPDWDGSSFSAEQVRNSGDLKIAKYPARKAGAATA